MCGKTYYMIQGGLLIQATKQHNPVSLSALCRLVMCFVVACGATTVGKHQTTNTNHLLLYFIYRAVFRHLLCCYLGLVMS